MSYLSLLQLAAPETVIVLASLAVIATDLLGLREVDWMNRSRILALVACAGCVVAIGWMAALPQHASATGGVMVVDGIRQAVKTGILVLTLLTVLLSVDSRFTPHAGEYLALVLLASAGMMFLVSSDDILMIFISLEMTSLSLYVLAGFQKDNRYSAEAALKYFLFGGISAAFTLFGLSLVYGISGATNLGEIALSIHGPQLDPLLVLAMVMVAVGFAFKVAAAPFHLWAPDVYQGAPVPSAAFIASASKVAGFFVLARVFTAGFTGAAGTAAWDAFQPGWVTMLAIISAVSMLFGNVAALAQTSVKRLLAYSAVAHAGYMLLGVMSARGQALAALLYYVLTYAITTLGAFAVVGVIQDRSGMERISDFAGLSRRSPLLSFCMLVFLLSLAGIPPFAGFFGKFYVFSAALGAPARGLDLLWLVILALLMSAVSLYYYLKVLKHIYVLEPADDRVRPLRVPPFTGAVLVASAVLVIVLGCAPSLLVRWLETAIATAAW